MHAFFSVLRRSMCRGHANWPRTGKLAPKLWPRKIGDTLLTSPVMCPGMVFVFDVVATDGHDVNTKFGPLEHSRTCAISKYVKMCLLGKHPHFHLFFPARSNMPHSL